MWYLNSENNDKVIYIAGQNKEVLIGRNTDPDIFSFVIPDDPSISRKHALLSTASNKLFVKDLDSRYGTFLNDNHEKIESNSQIQLSNLDIVKFGKMGSVWKVNFINLVTSSSTLKGENLQNLRQCMVNLSGTLKNEWDDDCKFLTMPAITLTMKVVLALVQGANIVTVEYWNKCLENIKQQSQLPDPKKYTPAVIESTLNKENVSFLPDNHRQLLFTGKKLIFFSKRQYEMYKIVLTKASATPLLLSECKMTKSALCGKDVIVIQCSMPSTTTQETQNQRNQIQDIVNYLKSKGKRLVTDVEIGLAILYCSTEKYCNPEFNFPSEVIKQTDQNSNPSKVLAQESQDTSQSNKHKDNIVINESLSSISVSDKLSSKRKINDIDDSSNSINDSDTPNKKVAVDNMSVGLNSTKRKATESSDDSNPSKKFATDMDSNDSQEAFNFVKKIDTNNSDNNVGAGTKRLNLVKPQKRKIDTDDDEDLFNFVNDKTKLPCTSKSKTFDTNNIKIEEEETKSTNNTESSMICNNVDLESLRGRKLEELMKNNEKLLSEDYDTSKNDINEKLNRLSLGMTIVTVKKELIIKKEPICIEEPTSHVKNFKKFKKVWPVKMSVTIIPKSSSISDSSNTDKVLENLLL